MRIFKEEQWFRQLWLFIVIGISTLIPMGITIVSYMKDPEAFSPMELFAVICILLFAVGFIFIFKLETRIDPKGIHYKFFPFHWSPKQISWNAINKAYVRTYDPLGDYGGWGLKGGGLWKKSKGKAVNVSGNIGIQLELNNGKKLLIGTKKENEAKQVLETYRHKINSSL